MYDINKILIIVAHPDDEILGCELSYNWQRSRDSFYKPYSFNIKKMGIKKLIGEYISTKKNELAKDIYRKLCFKEEKEKNGISIWKIDPIDFKPVFPKYIKTEKKDGGI